MVASEETRRHRDCAVSFGCNGGPLWEPLCYAQIGGLTIATFVTLLLVPVLYSFVVLDLKLIRWEQTEHTASDASEKPAEMPAISGVHA